MRWNIGKEKIILWEYNMKLYDCLCVHVNLGEKGSKKEKGKK